MQKTTTKAKPFLKWAGGKTQMLEALNKYVPQKFNKYIEPFIGGGALFFNIEPSKAIISDSNEELILTYKIIKESPLKLIKELKKFKNESEFYYDVRSWDVSKLSNIQRAARIIFLNKTCFNGLYRVNKKGLFNTPFGKRKNPTICDDKVILAASKALKNTDIHIGDFESILNTYAEPGDLIFLDPPYVPIGKYADFKRYTKEFFGKEDHERLKRQFDRLIKMGATPILTNSDSPFVIELFKDYEIKVIETRRSISSKSSTRKGKDVIIIGK